MKTKQIRNTVIAGIGILRRRSQLTAGCGKADTRAAAASDDKVVLAEPSWVGAQANAAVVKKLLEDELDVKVEAKQMDEPVAFDALNSGKADAILEDWHGVPKKQKKYVEEKKTVVSGGDLGVVGHIGWFVPKYYADKHPDIKDYKNLNKYAKDFRTSESGDKGHFIGAAPSYSQHDKELIKNLKLDFKHVPSGAEAAQLKEIQRLYDAKKPFLTYWWEPQWMNNKIDMVEIKLPKYTPGCEDAGGEGQVRLRDQPAREVPQRGLREGQQRRREVHQELQVDHQGPERGRGEHRRQEDEAGGRGREVDQGEQVHVGEVDAEEVTPSRHH